MAANGVADSTGADTPVLEEEMPETVLTVLTNKQESHEKAAAKTSRKRRKVKVRMKMEKSMKSKKRKARKKNETGREAEETPGQQ